jgi:hypothetical protein
MVQISFADLELAFFFVSAGGLGENKGVIDMLSGKIFCHSAMAGDVAEEAWPDDVEDEKYIAIPHKIELDLGKALVFDFVGQFLPGDYDAVRDIFRRKGAYGRFKALLMRRGAVDRWHDFSAKAEEAALRAWCADNAIELLD